MKYTIAGHGTVVDLNDSHLKAHGGEGAIYIKNKTVYKICDAGKMIPEGKFRELSVLDHKKIIKPEEVILDKHKTPVGYTMKLVDNAIPLAQILTKVYREREGVTLNDILNLVQQMRDGIEHIHQKKILQVDGNEFNYMVTNDYKDVYFIDVNSYETPSYPAEVLMQSIRDWHVEVRNGRNIWTELSDWFSFAVLSFNMFIGMHPYKGRNPKFSNIKTLMMDQMKAHVSVLNPETTYPMAAVYPLTVIPDAYMNWYKAVLEQGKRLPPPRDFTSKIEFIAQIKKIVGSNNFSIVELFDFEEQIVGFLNKFNKEIVITKSKVYVNRRPKNKPNGKHLRISITPINRAALAVWIENEIVRIKNLETDEELPSCGGGTEMMSSEGRIYIKSDLRIYELVFIETGSAIIPSAKIVADVPEHGTQLFQGVAFLTLFNGIFGCFFPESGYCYQLAIPELNGYKLVDAKCEKQVLIVIGLKDGKYDRFIMRFSKDWSEYDVRKVENINFTGLNFTVLDNELCVSLNEEEEIEIFSGKKDATSVKVVKDNVIDSDMRLCHIESQVCFANNTKLYKMSMRN
jgi:hypothetical protein